MKFPTEEIRALLRDELGSPEWEDAFDIVTEIEGAHSRWHREIHVILQYKADGKLYKATWRRGATESQENEIYEYAGEEVDLPQVFPVEVVKIEYKTEAELAKHWTETHS